MTEKNPDNIQSYSGFLFIFEKRNQMSDTKQQKKETQFGKAIYEFRKKYPTCTISDMQTFALGWEAALLNKSK